MSGKPDLERLERKLGYKFRDKSWLKLALTHRSKSKRNYERLEFLGDSVLGFIISDSLFKKFPKEPEGILTRLRANTVRQKSLAKLARQFKLGEYLILGAGESRSGGQQRDSTLSDVLEAIIAAIYLDGGMEPARKFVERIFADTLELLDPAKQLKDPKTRLQERLQKQGHEVPEYLISQISGKDHDQTFEIECRVAISDEVFKGTGSSRRKAEQNAAQHVLDRLNIGKLDG